MIPGHRAGDGHHAEVSGTASDLRGGLAFATFAARGDDHGIVCIVARALAYAAVRRTVREPSGAGTLARGLLIGFFLTVGGLIVLAAIVRLLTS